MLYGVITIDELFINGIFINFLDMPYSIGSFITINDDGTYTIFLNSRQCYEKNLTDLKHELRHIECGHMSDLVDAQLVEYETHKKDVT